MTTLVSSSILDTAGGSGAWKVRVTFDDGHEEIAVTNGIHEVRLMHEGVPTRLDVIGGHAAGTLRVGDIVLRAGQTSASRPMTGEEWVAAYCKQHGLDWDKLEIPEKRGILRSIPCNVRCWRVGVGVDTTPGEPCPECGSPVPLPTAWERITQETDTV